MPKRAIKSEDLLKFNFVGDPQISPDGSRVLFSKKTINDKNKYITNLFTVDMDGKLLQWTAGEKDGGGRWSPDGAQIAFIRGKEKGGAQFHLIPSGGGEARALSHLPEGSIGGYRWSPNGKWIAFTFREQHRDRTESARKEREEKGLSSPPWEIDDIFYRLDGDGYYGGQRYAIYLLDTASGDHQKIYDAATDGGYSFDWSPDSEELAVLHTATKRPMFEPANDQIWRVTREGQAWKLDGLFAGSKGNIRWSPDGKHLAFFGNPDDNGSWGDLNQRLYVVSAGGGEPQCLTSEDDFCMTAGTISDTREAGYGGVLEWSPDSHAIYLQIGWHGQTHIGFVQLQKPGKTTLLTSGNFVLTAGNLSRNGERIACTYTDPNTIGEVGVYDLSKDKERPTLLTHINKPLEEELKLSEPEEIWLESTDGVQIQAWVMKPIDYMAPKRYPAVLEIHGGPHAQYGWTFFHEFQVLAAQGYVVVFSNPRGSKGYGEKHTTAIHGHWGNKDWDDIQTVTRWMQHQPYIHPGQMGIMGGSYGGYMTNWAIGHTDEFRAAISDRCVSNLISMGGSSDFVQREDSYWKGSFFGNTEDLWRDSPIAYFHNVKTPTLLIHSEGDLRCNIEQSEQVFSALQHQGVESRFVRYPQNTSHGMSRTGPPDMRLHRLGEITSWWAKFLK